MFRLSTVFHCRFLVLFSNGFFPLFFPFSCISSHLWFLFSMHCVMDCNVISCILGKKSFISILLYTFNGPLHLSLLCFARPPICTYTTYIHVVVHLFLFNLSLSIACTIDHFISHLLSATGAIFALVHCFSSGYSFRCVLFFIVFVLRFYSQRIDNEFGASSAKGSVKFHTKPFKADSRFLCCCNVM